MNLFGGEISTTHQAIIIGIVGITIVALIVISRWKKRVEQEEHLSFSSAKDLLKFVPLEAEFSIIMRYTKTKESIGIKTQNVEYFLNERRKVYVSFDFSQVIENRDLKTKVIMLSRLPEPKIEILKIPLKLSDKTVKNKGAFGISQGEVDTHVILKVRDKAVSMLKESAEQSGIKEMAQKRLNERIEILRNAAVVQGWKLQIA